MRRSSSADWRRRSSTGGRWSAVATLTGWVRVKTGDAPCFERRLAAALEYRRSVVCDSDAYRLVHAEADLLPGLMVDRYGDYLAVQTLDQGMDAAKEWIVAGLVALLAPKGI